MENNQFEFLWNKIRERAKSLVNPISYSTFIENLDPVDVVNKKIVLRAETELTAKLITTNHADKLREAIATSETGLSDFVIIVEGSEEYTLRETPDALEETPVVIDKRYTFDSYVVGSSNRYSPRQNRWRRPPAKTSTPSIFTAARDLVKRT